MTRGVTDSIASFTRKLARDVAEVDRLQTAEHTVTADHDLRKFFRSRPGSADYRGRCSCGRETSGFYYDERQARRGLLRHLREVTR